MAAELTRRFTLGELFDRLRRLRPFRKLPPEIAAEIASFDVLRMTTRTNGDTVVIDELIRVKTGAGAHRCAGGDFDHDVRAEPMMHGSRALGSTFCR